MHKISTFSKYILHSVTILSFLTTLFFVSLMFEAQRNSLTKSQSLTYNKISGGARILYHYTDDLLVLLITLFGKTEKEDITQAERNTLKRTVPLLVAKYRGESYEY